MKIPVKMMGAFMWIQQEHSLVLSFGGEKVRADSLFSKTIFNSDFVKKKKQKKRSEVLRLDYRISESFHFCNTYAR